MFRIFLIGLLLIVVQLISSFLTQSNKHLAKLIRLFGTIGVGVFAFFLMLTSMIYTKSEQEIGFVNVLGQNSIIEGSGIKVKVPFISKVHLFPGTTQSMTIGYVEQNTDGSDYEVMQNESLMITSDFNFIEMDFYLEYQITDPIAYYYGTDDPINILRDCALTAIKNNVGLTDVDSAMTTGKAVLESQITDSLVAEITCHELGITLGKVSLQDVDVPTQEVKDAFAAVESAKQNASERENNAIQYANEQIPAAEAVASKIISDAEAEKTERINKATAEVSTFNALWEQYKSSDVVREKLYYETLVEILPNMDIIISENGKIVYVARDSETVTGDSASVAGN